jgi:hypothetical protein
MKRTKLLVVAVLALVICLPGMAGATLINNTSSFGAGTVIEGFEGIAPSGTNTGAIYAENYFPIGTVGAYDFGNGVSLTSPNPPAYNWPTGPYIHDFSIANPNTGNNYEYYGANGNIGAATDMPAGFGTAYLGVEDTGLTTKHLTFTFDNTVLRAGLYLTGWPGTCTLSALDASGNVVLENWVVTVAAVSGWDNGFVGIERLSGFQKLDISYASGTDFNPGVDNLTFQSVPLPPSVLLMGTGLLGLVGLGWRRRKES